MSVALSALEFLAAERSRLDTRGREALDLLGHEVQRQRQLLLELLELAHAQAEGTDDEPTALLQVVREAVARQGRPTPVEVAPDAREVHVLMHPVRIGRILANLLDNAERHGGGATRVFVRRHGGRAWVAVEDAGPGVAPEARERIFTRFRSGGPPDERDGIHLGLALCREDVRRAGGDLVLEDREEGGSRFGLIVPIDLPR
jgi:two-component system, OmpR family, sensor histidine kinase MtrB